MSISFHPLLGCAFCDPSIFPWFHVSLTSLKCLKSPAVFPQLYQSDILSAMISSWQGQGLTNKWRGNFCCLFRRWAGQVICEQVHYHHGVTSSLDVWTDCSPLPISKSYSNAHHWWFNPVSYTHLNRNCCACVNCNRGWPFFTNPVTTKLPLFFWSVEIAYCLGALFLQLLSTRPVVPTISRFPAAEF